MKSTITPKQREAVRTVSLFKRTLLYGGARSGKTFIAIWILVYIAIRYPGTRQMVNRRFACDVRAAIWKITIPSVLRMLGLVIGEDYKTNEQQMEITFTNGSVLICAGLDDKERVEKILGQEYATIYINESQDVPWPTIKILRTRLSQKCETINRLIVDLNPTTIAHWTYKLWFLNEDPETGTKLDASEFGKLQMNPYDNAQNLSQDYIKSELEALTGNARNRFLLGEYSANTELRVFSPKHRYHWQEFVEWVGSRWADVRLVAGLDLGYQDADAFSVLAYIDGVRDAWLVYEHKARRQNLDELANAIKAGLQWCWDNIPTPVKDCQIHADMATVRHGKEGDSKKTASQLFDLYGLPIVPAYKRDKGMAIEFLQTEVNEGFLHVPKNGAFDQESEKVIWTKGESGEIIREIDHENFHPDMMDALLYPYRWLLTVGNSALRSRSFDAPKPPQYNSTIVEKMIDSLSSTDYKYF